VSKRIAVGTLLRGFCGGYFGRDSYGTKRVEAVGADWVVARVESTRAVVFYEGDPDVLVQYIAEGDDEEGA
jgi:hypothetical protein